MGTTTPAALAVDGVVRATGEADMLPRMPLEGMRVVTRVEVLANECNRRHTVTLLQMGLHRLEEPYFAQVAEAVAPQAVLKEFGLAGPGVGEIFLAFKPVEVGHGRFLTRYSSHHGRDTSGAGPVVRTCPARTINTMPTTTKSQAFMRHPLLSRPHSTSTYRTVRVVRICNSSVVSVISSRRSPSPPGVPGAVTSGTNTSLLTSDSLAAGTQVS